MLTYEAFDENGRRVEGADDSRTPAGLAAHLRESGHSHAFIYSEGYLVAGIDPRGPWSNPNLEKQRGQTRPGEVMPPPDQGAVSPARDASRRGLEPSEWLRDKPAAPPLNLRFPPESPAELSREERIAAAQQDAQRRENERRQAEARRQLFDNQRGGQGRER